MARTWFSVTVELLGGRDGDLWPWPGRIFAVGPAHTFMDLAEAINDAFARWDRSHLSVFTLADGRLVTDEESGAEMTADIGGPLTVPLDIATTKVVRTLGLGDEFQYTFDLGDNWTHRCVVGMEKIDPLQELGTRPSTPLPYWGWGTIPDQYGRRWMDDTGEGRDIDDALQQVGAGIPMALEQRPEEVEPIALSIHHRLTWRGGTGDRDLAEDLLARLRGQPLPGEALPVDLDMLATLLETAPGLSEGGYLDLRTSEVCFDSDTDPMVVGEDAAVDVTDEPGRMTGPLRGTWQWGPRDLSPSGAGRPGSGRCPRPSSSRRAVPSAARR